MKANDKDLQQALAGMKKKTTGLEKRVQGLEKRLEIAEDAIKVSAGLLSCVSYLEVANGNKVFSPEEFSWVEKSLGVLHNYILWREKEN